MPGLQSWKGSNRRFLIADGSRSSLAQIIEKARGGQARPHFESCLQLRVRLGQLERLGGRIGIFNFADARCETDAQSGRITLRLIDSVRNRGVKRLRTAEMQGRLLDRTERRLNRVRVARRQRQPHIVQRGKHVPCGRRTVCVAGIEYAARSQAAGKRTARRVLDLAACSRRGRVQFGYSGSRRKV